MPDYEHVSFRRWEEREDGLYAVNNVTNDIVVIDKDSMHIDRVLNIDLEVNAGDSFPFYFQHLISSKDRVYLLPYHYGRKMVIYDLNTKHVTVEAFNRFIEYGTEITPFRYAKVGDKYFFPPERLGDPFVVFDRTNEEFIKKDLIEKDIKKMYGDTAKIPFISCYDKNDEIWFAVNSLNERVCVNLQSGENEVYHLEGLLANEKDYFMDCDSRFLWYVSGETNMLFRLERSSGEIRQYNIEGDKSIWKPILLGERLYLISVAASRKCVIKVFDIFSSQFVEEVEPGVESLKDFRGLDFLSFVGHGQRNETTYLFPENSDSFLFINNQNGKIEKQDSRLDVDKFHDYISSKIRKAFLSGGMREDGAFGLREALTGKFSELFVEGIKV